MFYIPSGSLNKQFQMDLWWFFTPFFISHDLEVKPPNTPAVRGWANVFSYNSEFPDEINPYFKTMNHLFLVGGWTNPSEKYDRHIGSFSPRIRGENKTCFKPPASFHAFKFNFRPQKSTEGPTTPRSLPFLPELRGENWKNGFMPRVRSLPFKNRSIFLLCQGFFTSSSSIPLFSSSYTFQMVEG